MKAQSGDARHLPIEDRSVDLVLCSPPFWGYGESRYGGMSGIGDEPTHEEYVESILGVQGELRRVCRGPIWMCVGVFGGAYIDSFDCYQKVDWPIKENVIHGGAWIRTTESGELDESIFQRDELRAYPKVVIMRMIEALTRPGAVVLDPFSGTNTTARAARDTGRQWLAFEKSERMRNGMWE